MIPVLLIVALLVVGGIWLSRPDLPQKAETQTTTPGIVQAQTDSDTDTSEDTSGTDTSEAGDTETETTEPDTTEPDTTEPDTTEPQTEPAEGEEPSDDAATQDSSATPSDTTTEETTDETTTGEAAADTAKTDTAEPMAAPTPPEGFTITPFSSEEQTREFTEAQQVLEEGKDYQTIIVTNKGNMRLDLFEDQAPNTVNNFIFLALNHYYDGVVFHRVLQDFMAQTGDPTGTGTGGPGYQFEDEILDTLQFDKRGLLAMANAGPGTNGSQFFITFVETPHLNGLHTIFGELVEGDDVLSNIKLIEPGQGSSQPSVIAMMSDTLESLAGKGITLAGEPTTTLETYLTETLGSLPEIGSEFEVDGIRAISGRMADAPAVGFYAEGEASNEPDVMQAVYIIEKPKDAEPTTTETTDVETTDTETTDTETTETDSEQ
jgi:cyclophilin family peptidyl-prolyl cis-trans isomerase